MYKARSSKKYVYNCFVICQKIDKNLKKKSKQFMCN